jgi:poly(3-hydroxybutyrate) depolymerase
MAKRRFLIAPLVIATLLALTTGGTALSSTAGGATTPTDAGTAEQTAGCGQGATLTDGTYTIQSSGQDRTFILDVPDNYDNTNPYRLIFGLHWYGGTAEDVATGQTVETGTWAYYGLQQLAENSAIFVAPQGIDNGWANTDGQDVIFIDDIIAMIEADLCVDTTQRFAIGFSYGGAMSYALACSRPDVFRAVVVQSGGGPSGCEGGTQPIAYFGVHGIGDSEGIGETARDMFVASNGCTPQDPPEPAAGSLTHITTAYEGCEDGYPVQWAAFDGGHMPAPQDGATGDSGSNTWVPAEAWAFFTQFESTAPPQ